MRKEVYWRLLSVSKWVHNLYLWETLKFGYRVDLLHPLFCVGEVFFLSLEDYQLCSLHSRVHALLSLPEAVYRCEGVVDSVNAPLRGTHPERHTQGTIPACTAAVHSCLHACLTLQTCSGLWHSELRFLLPSSIFAFQKMPRPNIGIRK